MPLKLALSLHIVCAASLSCICSASAQQVLTPISDLISSSSASSLPSPTSSTPDTTEGPPQAPDLSQYTNSYLVPPAAAPETNNSKRDHPLSMVGPLAWKG